MVRIRDIPRNQYGQIERKDWLEYKRQRMKEDEAKLQQQKQAKKTPDNTRYREEAITELNTPMTTKLKQKVTAIFIEPKEDYINRRIREKKAQEAYRQGREIAAIQKAKQKGIQREKSGGFWGGLADSLLGPKKSRKQAKVKYVKIGKPNRKKKKTKRIQYRPQKQGKTLDDVLFGMT